MLHVTPVCSYKPRPAVQNNRSKGSQHWVRDVFHVARPGSGETFCGRDAAEWVRMDAVAIAVVKDDPNLCTRCKARL